MTKIESFSINDNAGEIYYDADVDTNGEFAVDTIVGYLPALNLIENKTVVDMGAHYGYFAKAAQLYGARETICYEPYHQAYFFMIAYQQIENGIFFNQAVVGGFNRDVMLTVYDDDTSANSICSRSDRKNKVPAFAQNFNSILSMYNPHVLKIDVEGSEWYYNFSMLNEKLEMLCIEIHYMHGYTWRDDIVVKKDFSYRDKESGLSERLKKIFPKVLKDKLVMCNHRDKFSFDDERDYIFGRELILTK